jgi:hypothetical protein
MMEFPVLMGQGWVVVDRLRAAGGGDQVAISSCTMSYGPSRADTVGNGHVRTQLIESAWAYQHHAAVGAELKRRQAHADAATVARSWAAQQRLCGRFRRLAARTTDKKVVVTAIARELAGFAWAEMTAG